MLRFRFISLCISVAEPEPAFFEWSPLTKKPRSNFYTRIRSWIRSQSPELEMTENELLRETFVHC